MTVAKLVHDLTWLLTSGDFWISFWSGVASLVLGIPTAIWLTRGAERRQERRERDEAHARLRSALEILRSTLEGNRTQIDRTLGALSENKNPLVVALNTDAWHLLQDDIAPLVLDPQLRTDLGWHFAHLRFCLELHGRFIEFVLRPQFGDGAQRQAMITTLSSLLNQATTHIDQLTPRLAGVTVNADTSLRSKMAKLLTRVRAYRPWK